MNPFVSLSPQAVDELDAILTYHLSMFYQVRKDTIEVLSFWDNRKDSKQSGF